MYERMPSMLRHCFPAASTTDTFQGVVLRFKFKYQDTSL